VSEKFYEELIGFLDKAGVEDDKDKHMFQALMSLKYRVCGAHRVGRRAVCVVGICQSRSVVCCCLDDIMGASSVLIWPLKFVRDKTRPEPMGGMIVSVHQ
jgi:hypothetical protein